jgi:hypothetical protein
MDYLVPDHHHDHHPQKDCDQVRMRRAEAQRVHGLLISVHVFRYAVVGGGRNAAHRSEGRVYLTVSFAAVLLIPSPYPTSS